jgi:hypothetical protein
MRETSRGSCSGVAERERQVGMPPGLVGSVLWYRPGLCQCQLFRIYRAKSPFFLGECRPNI